MEYLNFMFVLLSFMLVVIIVLFNKVQHLEKKSIENFNNNIVEHMTDDTKNQIKQIIQQEYNYDLEAIRNLGAISKSLLTGKNYHSNDVTLSSVGYSQTSAKLCDAPSANTISGLSATNDNEAKTVCSNDDTCKGFTKTVAGSYTFYNDIPGTRFGESGDSCFEKQTMEGDLENNILTIPANVRILGNITVDGNAEIDGNAVIGPAYIGHHTGTKNPNGNWAQFSHKNRKDGNRNFALLQKNDGETVLNRSNGKPLQVRENNEMKGGIEIGNAYIGSGRHHDTYAEFSHRARGSGNGDYSFLSSSEGYTHINTKSGKGIYTSENNSNIMNLHKNGISGVRFVEIKSNSEYIHFDHIRVITNSGEDLISKKDSNGNYIIPDSSFVEVGKSYSHGLFQGYRQAYKVRKPYGNHDIGKGWEHYFHSSGGNKTWRVDLGDNYEILRVEYDYRHSFGRQTGAADSTNHDSLILKDVNETELFNDNVKDYNHVNIGGTTGQYTKWDLSSN